MSDKITLEVAPRDTLGKAVKTLRRQDLIPGVIHDHGKDSIHFQVDYQTFFKVYKQSGKSSPVELSVGGKKYTVLVRDIDRHPRLNNITHIVLNAVKANEKVETEVPVKPRYTEGNESSPAEKTGLIVLAQLDVVTVKALPRDLPGELTYDAEKLVEVGDQATVADLEVPKDVEIETDAEQVVATVFEPSALAAANEAAAGDAEDVSGSGSADEDTESTDSDEAANSESQEEKTS